MKCRVLQENLLAAMKLIAPYTTGRGRPDYSNYVTMIAREKRVHLIVNSGDAIAEVTLGALSEMTGKIITAFDPIYRYTKVCSPEAATLEVQDGQLVLEQPGHRARFKDVVNEEYLPETPDAEWRLVASDLPGDEFLTAYTSLITVIDKNGGDRGMGVRFDRRDGKLLLIAVDNRYGTRMHTYEMDTSVEVAGFTMQLMSKSSLKALEKQQFTLYISEDMKWMKFDIQDVGLIVPTIRLEFPDYQAAYVDMESYIATPVREYTLSQALKRVTIGHDAITLNRDPAALELAGETASACLETSETMGTFRVAVYAPYLKELLSNKSPKDPFQEPPRKLTTTEQILEWRYGPEVNVLVSPDTYADPDRNLPIIVQQGPHTAYIMPRDF